MAGISLRAMRSLPRAIPVLLLLAAACNEPVPTTTTTTTTTTSTTRLTTTTATQPPTTTTMRATTTTTTSSTTTLPGAFKAPYADGYLGFYDSSTIPLWPQRMILMLGEANAQGPLIAPAK